MIDDNRKTICSPSCQRKRLARQRFHSKQNQLQRERIAKQKQSHSNAWFVLKNFISLVATTVCVLVCAETRLPTGIGHLNQELLNIRDDSQAIRSDNRCFFSGADFGGNSKREANWEYYKTVDPDDLLNELSYAYLKSFVDDINAQPMLGVKPTDEELN